ncbi:MAG: hypothetical protein ACKN81_17290, partial [Pirellulaceae bacterium]
LLRKPSAAVSSLLGIRPIHQAIGHRFPDPFAAGESLAHRASNTLSFQDDLSIPPFSTPATQESDGE